MTTAVPRAVPVELTADRRFAGRIVRLARTSVVALGLIWMLAALTLDAPWPVAASLAAGWVLMPITLLASLGRPLLRYGLVLPSSLVGLPLLAVSVAWLPRSGVAAAGWLLITAGVLLGGVLGTWFWFRFAPVPRLLDDPFSATRLALIRLHVGLILTGIALASAGVLTS